MKAWARIDISKREIRRGFGRRRYGREGVDEYVIKIEGFSGELRKTMTAEEASSWVKRSNGAAFKAAAKASEIGVEGYERFTKHGKVSSGMSHVIMRAAGRSFGKKKETKDDKGKPKQ